MTAIHRSYLIGAAMLIAMTVLMIPSASARAPSRDASYDLQRQDRWGELSQKPDASGSASMAANWHPAQPGRRLSLPRTQEIIGLSLSVSVETVCGPEISHRLDVAWEVTGIPAVGVEIGIVATLPDGATHTRLHRLQPQSRPLVSLL